MVKKLRIKFITYAMISVFLLLTVILGSINIVNFSMLGQDADNVTQMIASNRGQFDSSTNNQNRQNTRNPNNGMFPNNEGFNPTTNEGTQPPTVNEETQESTVNGGMQAPTYEDTETPQGTEPPATEGTEPPAIDGSEPPAFDNGTQPPTFDNGSQPPTFDNGMQPPTFDNGMQPPTFDNGTQPPAFENGMQPQMPGQMQPPTSDQMQPPANGQTEPSIGGEMQPPTEGQTPGDLIMEPNSSQTEGETTVPNNENQTPNQNQQELGKMGAMGPNSPEIRFSTRYFTVQFDSNNNGTMKVFNISAIDESEAIEWAESLLGKKETGWTKTSYRYRIYTEGDTTYVTVIDQGREMLPSLRVLYASIIGTVVGLIISFVVLLYVSKLVVKPIDEANKKQKRFISGATTELKNPITTIDANNTIIESKYGESDETISTFKQIHKLSTLTKSLNTLTVLDEIEKTTTSNFDLSSVANEIVSSYASLFAEKGLTFKYDIDENITLNAEEGMIRKLITEILDNALKFTTSKAYFTIVKSNDRVMIKEVNDATDLPTGSLDLVFERFYKYDNAKMTDGTGIGLSIVKEIVEVHKGRVYASSYDNNYQIKAEL